jgi:predicted AAA+ superfamily ATPase
MNESFRDVGKILENMVYIELLRRGYLVHTLKVGVKEVDFMATKGSEKMYFQVAYTFGEEGSATFKREFGNLTMIKDHYEKVVITLDSVQHASVEGVKHIMAEEWFISDF